MADTVIPQMTVDQMAVLSMSFLSKDICVFFKFDLGSPRTFARSLRSIWLTELSRRTDGSALTEFRGRVSLLYDSTTSMMVRCQEELRRRQKERKNQRD